jgi:hypothetical protein
MSETRKIAAILAADVVGYSRLAGADEDRTLARLRALRSDLIDPTIAAVWSTPCAARLKCRTAWSSATPARPATAASIFASAFIWAMSSRRQTAT